ncbi:hypothetical protein DFP72DRAFT_1067038 [Ephemerocybe angulata]|uniref:Uncharacterized protein n=1 Tax=Ephemerocybe angulata TaxID=980116 RepID=A0A8H6M8Q3_9AGAR|nr:hypothetical protein DFP72DRAFT_1067038 [Tulosesus angulatus]
MLFLWPIKTPSLLFIYSWLFPVEATPASCVPKSGTLLALATCLDTFTIPPGYYDEDSYHDAQPTEDERRAWTLAVTSLLSVDGSCSSSAVPQALEDSYSIQKFTPSGSKSSYCVLLETSLDCDGYPRGWGHVIVPETRAQVSRSIHVSAPHPKFDLGTVEQATAIFEMTGAKSLLLAGRTRPAFHEPSTCITTASKPYYRTDPAHSPTEPFFDAFVAIYEWQQQYGGCPSSSCAFIQMHGKGSKTCANDQVFLSTGLKDNPWYTSPADYPIKRLKKNLEEVFQGWTISLPSDSKCTLTASGNVGGRFINQVPRSHVCSTPTTPDQVKGEFIHIEQAIESRRSNVYRQWAQAVKRTFETTCARDMDLHPTTLLCVERDVAEDARAWPWVEKLTGGRLQRIIQGHLRS